MKTFSIFFFKLQVNLFYFFTKLTVISLYLNIVSEIHSNKQKYLFLSAIYKRKPNSQLKPEVNPLIIILLPIGQKYQIKEMYQQSSGSKQSHQQKFSQKSQKKLSRNLFALIGQTSKDINPYRSKFQLNSIGSGKSRQSRDSDLLNRLAKESSKASSKSLSRNVSYQYFVHEKQHKSQMNSSKSNSIISESQKSLGKEVKIETKDKQTHDKKNKVIETEKMAPRIHNCVCMVAGECLGYYCNCFLSPYPCAPDCCPNCLTLKSSLPLKFTNVCSCKKTRCLKLYCECLAKGLYCNPMCQCNMCENHEHSISRIETIDNYQMYRGCSCQKSHCRKKYCDCFAQGIKCTSKCVCIDCHNLLQLKQKGTKMQAENDERFNNNQQKMDEQNEKQEEEMQFQAIDFFGFQNKRKK